MFIILVRSDVNNPNNYWISFVLAGSSWRRPRRSSSECSCSNGTGRGKRRNQNAKWRFLRSSSGGCHYHCRSTDGLRNPDHGRRLDSCVGKPELYCLQLIIYTRLVQLHSVSHGLSNRFARWYGIIPTTLTL